MTGKRDDFASCLTLPNLMRAADICYRNVRWKRRAQSFMSRELTGCRELQRELMDGSYRPRPTSGFHIIERGKPRDIRPVDFRDRVVQRCLCDNALGPAIEAYVSADCSACLKGRGLKYSHERVRRHAEACPADGWVLQYDFHDYFHSIDRGLLKGLVCELLDDGRLRALTLLTITTGERGLELGSHVSQLLACAFATPVDRALSSVPGVSGIHRYMDDGIAFCEGRAAAIMAREALRDAAGSLRLTLNERKTHVNRVSEPFVFCKMRFTKQPDGSVRLNVRKQQSRKSVRHARNVMALASARPELCIGTAQVVASLGGYLGSGDADLSRLVRPFEEPTS